MTLDESFKRPGTVPFKWEVQPGIPKQQGAAGDVPPPPTSPRLALPPAARVAAPLATPHPQPSHSHRRSGGPCPRASSRGGDGEEEEEEDAPAPAPATARTNSACCTATRPPN
ncbi:hypothetical protein Zm00014a_019783 [Zea mays]|uniref:Uncharacterized protein n=1 Tax=Zea mays TaxID=4577 RepID=A0A317YJ77_MAIZE|nr:hypothetical protein Zm00014a_019783 [Zea mays]